MNYSDLCQAFYISSTEGILKGHEAQASISHTLIEWAISSDDAFDKLPTSSSSYDKWYSGETAPTRMWKYIKEEIDEEAYAGKLEAALNEKHADKLAKKLGIRVASGEKIDTPRLTRVVAKILYTLAEERGDAQNIDADEFYRSFEIKTDFTDYINTKREWYSVMKLIGGDEVSLEDYFVCNYIGDKLRVGFNKQRSKAAGGYIEGATLEKIRNLYASRGVDNRKVLLLGSGGSGKTLMMQHLFLDALDRFQEIGILPVFLELRNMVPSKSINQFIADSLNVTDDLFDENKVDDLLRAGKFHILFDGLDEVDHSDVDSFLEKLKDFASKYQKVQIVIASRDCDAVKGIHLFKTLYVWPFDNDQSLELIERILEKEDALEAKDEILKYIDKGFIKKDGVFASHPMMLTFVTINYPKFHRFYNNHLSFYQQAYDALLSGHDENKKPYSRKFVSVNDAKEFTTIFGEFCAKTYVEGKKEFELEEFKMVFSQLTTKGLFDNSKKKLDYKNFLQDACSTACMMYEENDKVIYIDPGFQEYLFADYYLNADTAETEKMGKQLMDKEPHLFDNLDAFNMIYDTEQKRFEYCILKPFLESVFKGQDEVGAFKNFLIHGYDQFNYTVMNTVEVEKYVDKTKVDYNMGILSLNDPRTIVLTYLLKVLNIAPKTSYYVTDREDAVAGEVVSPVYGQWEKSDGKKVFSLSTYFSNEYMRDKFGAGSDIEYVMANDSEPAVMGKTYRIDTLDIADNPDSYDAFVNAMKEDGCEVYENFLKMKAYYEQMVRAQRREGLRTR